MANTLLTPQVIANEALIALENNLIMANLVHRDYEKEFAQVGDTVTVRRPTTFTAENFTGSITRQDVTEGSVAVQIDRHRDVSFAVTSKEMTLDVKDFSEQFIHPAMRAISQSVDVDLLNEVANISEAVPGTAAPTNLADIANISKAMDLKGVPMDQRRLVLSPTHKYRYALTDNLSKVAYAGNNETLRNAELGRIYTLDTYMDQNCPDTKAATAGTATAYKVTGTKGQNTVALSDVTAATATVKRGDAFILDGYRYYFTEDKTAVSGAIASIGISAKLVKDYTAQAAYVVNKTHSLAFHRNAIALVTRPLALPMGAANAAVASDNGLGVRVVYGYDQDTKKDTVSIDLIYGIKTLDSDLAVKLVG